MVITAGMSGWNRAAVFAADFRVPAPEEHRALPWRRLTLRLEPMPQEYQIGRPGTMTHDPADRFLEVNHRDDQGIEA